MSPGHEESRPRQESGPVTSTAPSMPHAMVDALTVVDRSFMRGYMSGYLAGEHVGHARGWQACDEEIATLQRTAYEIVMRLAGLEPHRDREDRRRRSQVDAAARHAAAAEALPAEGVSRCE